MKKSIVALAAFLTLMFGAFTSDRAEAGGRVQFGISIGVGAPWHNGWYGHHYHPGYGPVVLPGYGWRGSYYHYAGYRYRPVHWKQARNHGWCHVRHVRYHGHLYEKVVCKRPVHWQNHNIRYVHRVGHW
jgi:hypothetical protein